VNLKLRSRLVGVVHETQPPPSRPSGAGPQLVAEMNINSSSRTIANNESRKRLTAARELCPANALDADRRPYRIEQD
jgi:hypothetical protein